MSEGKPGNGSPEPDMFENTGPVLSFEKLILWSLDKLRHLNRRRESRRFAI